MWHDPRGADPMAFSALDRGRLMSAHGLAGNPALLSATLTMETMIRRPDGRLLAGSWDRQEIRDGFAPLPSGE
jgi:hypothetical protein